MYNDATNLLPPERKRALSRDFSLRIGVVAVVLVTVLTLAAAVLLMPTYVFLKASAGVKQARLASMEAAPSSDNEAALSARLASLSSNAAKLIALSDAPSVSAIISTALAISRPGITLSSLSYTPSVDKSPAILVISGSSSTRDALRNYQLMLQGASFAQSATLPVSAYANDTNIAFTITVTLAP